MIDMGRAAIIPLATALRLAPEQQESVVDVLGLIPYKTSVPFLFKGPAPVDEDRCRSPGVREGDRPP